jgi:hypothetical protein
VDPGDHHLCAGRQAYSKALAAASFTAEAGKSYYFRTKSHHARNKSSDYDSGQEELEPIDPAAAQLLIANSPFTVFQRKESKEPQDASSD